MAVENKYTNSSLAAGNALVPALLASGAEVKVLYATFEIAAADDDGSVYRVFKGLPADLIPIRIDVACDTITAGTDWDLGLYETDLGAVVDKDCLMDGQTLATASVFGLNGLGAVAIESMNTRLFEHAGHTAGTKKKSYDMAFTANTVGSAAGTVAIRATFVQG